MDTLTKPRGRAETLYLGYDGRLPASPAPTLRTHAVDAEGEVIHAREGSHLILREIRPDDTAALRRGFADLTAEEVRLRFLHPLTELPEALARKLCDIDVEHAAAF